MPRERWLWLWLYLLDGDVDGGRLLWLSFLLETASGLLVCPSVEQQGESEQDDPSKEKEFNHRSELC